MTGARNVLAAVLLVVAVVVTGGIMYWTMEEDEPEPQMFNIDELNGPLALTPGEQVRLNVGWNDPSVGIWFAVVETPPPEVAEVEKIDDNDVIEDAEIGGGIGKTYLMITAIAPGHGTIKVAECFRTMPDEDGICRDDDGGTRPAFTVDVVVEEG